MNLADNLKRIRKENNLSQEQLAEKLGVSRQAVSKWESGQSYPEMDKVLQICSLFNLNINELINENIKEVNERKEAKKISNKYIDSFFEYLTKVVDMFSSMKFKQIFFCLCEQVIVFLIIFFVLSMIGLVGESFVRNILYNFLPSSIYYFIYNFLAGIFLIVAFIVGVVIFFHIFKVRYLDYYEIVREDKNIDSGKNNKENNSNFIDNENEESISNDKESNKIILEKKKENIIIRDPKHSEFKFISGLGKAILLFIKFIAAWFLMFLAFGMIALVMCLSLSFVFIKTGTLFVGFLLAILGCILINEIFIEILYNFIVSHKYAKTRMFIIGLISLISIGLGSGLMVVGISDFDIENETVDLVNTDYTLNMKDNLMIARYYYDYKIEYKEEERENIKLVITHSKYYTSNIEESDGLIFINDYVPSEDAMKMLRIFIDNFNNKKILNYNNQQTVTVYGSKENIEKMQKNRNEYLNDRQRLAKELDDYINKMNRLETDNERLEELLERVGYVVVRDRNGYIIDIYKEYYEQ